MYLLSRQLRSDLYRTQNHVWQACPRTRWTEGSGVRWRLTTFCEWSISRAVVLRRQRIDILFCSIRCVPLSREFLMMFSVNCSIRKWSGIHQQDQLTTKQLSKIAAAPRLAIQAWKCCLVSWRRTEIVSKIIGVRLREFRKNAEVAELYGSRKRAQLSKSKRKHKGARTSLTCPT